MIFLELTLPLSLATTEKKPCIVHLSFNQLCDYLIEF